MSLQSDVYRAIQVLDDLGKNIRKERQGILAKAAKPMLATAKTVVPVSKKPHNRYNNGSHAAVYYPGNLKRSLQVLRFRRKKSAVFLGARFPKIPSGYFKGTRTDGYYMHWVEFGTTKMSGRPFWRPSWEATQNQVQENIKNSFRQIVNRYDTKT